MNWIVQLWSEEREKWIRIALFDGSADMIDICEAIQIQGIDSGDCRVSRTQEPVVRSLVDGFDFYIASSALFSPDELNEREWFDLPSMEYGDMLNVHMENYREPKLMTNEKDIF